MKILAIDSSTLTGGVALIRAGEDPALPPNPSSGCLELTAHSGREPSSVRSQPIVQIFGEMILSVSAQHSEGLLPAIERLFEESRLSLHEIDLIAVARGPGSFTGLRIGMATAQGLSLSLGKPMIGVSSLQGLALHGCCFPGLVVPLLDARRGEVYGAAFEGDQLTPIIEEQAIAPQAMVNLLKVRSEPLFLIGEGAVRYRELFEAGLEKAVFALEFMNARASHIGFLAWRNHQREAEAVPNYLRSAEVTFPR